MNTNKNSYTFIYASIVVIIVAFLLAFVSSALKDRQDNNVALDKKKQILASLNVLNVKDANAEYAKYVTSEMLVSTGSTDEGCAFATPTLKASIKEQLPVYVCTVEGETKYVLPLYGDGLWGPIWGYISLNADKNTVYGVYFSHASETPGLGAEITNHEKFQVPFAGKKVSKNGEIALSVVKHGNVKDAAYEVDGLSGATFTSTGVSNMLKDILSCYSAFLGGADAPAEACSEAKACGHACGHACEHECEETVVNE